MLPNVEHINLKPVLKMLKSKDVCILDLEELAFYKQEWYFQSEIIPNDYSFLLITCIDEKGKHTLPSDVLLFCPQSCNKFINLKNITK